MFVFIIHRFTVMIKIQISIMKYLLPEEGSGNDFYRQVRNIT